MDQSTALEYGSYVAPPTTFLAVTVALSWVLNYSWTIGIAAGFALGLAEMLAWRFFLIPSAR